MYSVFLKSSIGPKSPVAPIQPAKPRIAPLPESEWPLIVKGIALLRKTGETGVGDTVERLIGPERSQKFQEWFQRAFGKSCGCARRHAWLNARFPYP